MTNPDPTMSQILSSVNVPFFVTAVRELARQNRGIITDSGSALVGLGILQDAPLNLQIVLAALARQPVAEIIRGDWVPTGAVVYGRDFRVALPCVDAVCPPHVWLFSDEAKSLSWDGAGRVPMPPDWLNLGHRVIVEAISQRDARRRPPDADADADNYQKLSRARTRCAEALGSRPQCIGGDPIDIAARFVEASKEALNRIAAAVEVRGIGGRLPVTNVWPEDVTRLTERILERLEKIPQEAVGGYVGAMIEELTETLRHMGATGK